MSREWVVGFVAASPDHPLRRWLAPGRGHCWAARELDEGTWLWSEWTPNRIVTGICDVALVSEAAHAADLALVYAEGPDRVRPLRPVLAWHQCASHVAQLLGVALPWPGTPAALEGALMAAGGLPLPLGGPACSGAQPHRL